MPAIAIHNTSSSCVPETFRKGHRKSDEKNPLWKCFIKERNHQTNSAVPPLLQLIFTMGKKIKHNQKDRAKERERERENVLMSLIYQNLLFFFFSSWYFIPRGLQIVCLIFLPDKAMFQVGFALCNILLLCLLHLLFLTHTSQQVSTYLC